MRMRVVSFAAMASRASSVIRPTTAVGLRCIVASVLVAVLALVPCLVRATGHFEDTTATSLLRLNRGFERPPAKCAATAPSRMLVQSLSWIAPPRFTIARRVAALDASIPHSPPVQSPTALRAPPVAPFVS